MGVSVVGFLLFALSQVGTPGPANMALLATGARYGFRAALPFVAGVAFGKQLIIWPIGFGLMGLASTVPWLLILLKYVSAGYIFWLAWRVAYMRLTPGAADGQAPGFMSGLAVHPLNPKAWAMIVTGFTSFVAPGTSPFLATAIIALCLFLTQAICHPIWTFFGDRIARRLAGTRYERFLMWGLAAVTVLFVSLAIFERDI
jgi:threonine/homoserine/homoserine lactone efflux protein